MITIPTHDLVTMARDVAEFAPSARTDRELAYVRFACTGDALTVSTYAVSHGAVATWTPYQPEPGGLDEPWDVLLRVGQAKDLAKFFELKGAKSEIPVTIDLRQGVLYVSRPGDSEEGVDARRQTYEGDFEAVVPWTDKEFADLGERTNATVRIDSPAAHAIGLACKRGYLPLASTAHERGVRTEVGSHLVVFSRYPVADNGEADAQAIVEASLEAV